MPPPVDAPLPLLRLLQLVSPSLPVGAFAYSQGIEWAVEAGWIRTADDLSAWLLDQIEESLVYLEIPLLARLQAACAAQDRARVDNLVATVLAWRETAELRAEERQRGRAMAQVLIALEIEQAAQWQTSLAPSALAGFALASVHWGLSARAAGLGYAWSWLENLVLAGVKLVPLGQSDGQRLLLRLAEALPAAVDQGLTVPERDIGASLPALALASSLHETQYSRLFRS
ncbi:Urease accessory protein UreF [Thiorhodovibrio litoralis]|nr:urease accessory protein UreF [Thiorhodovibrio winogradskyi]WPL12903.1 Urease accessory protein UreF [Thiorhodovibrio litoralis]